MTKFLSKAVCLCICAVLLNINSYAKQTDKSQIFKEVEQAKANGLSFNEVTLFSVVEGDKHDVLSSEVTLSANMQAIKSLFDKKSDAITLAFTTADGKTYQLDAMRSNPFSNNPDIGFIDASGKHPFSHDKGLHYQGAIRGSEKSLAAISIFASSEVMILFANEDGNFVVGKLEDSDKYILYNDEDFLSKPEMPCGTTDDKVIEYEPSNGDKTTEAYQCNKVRLYWEADYGLYLNKTRSVTLTQDYLTGMFNQVQIMYRNERIALELTSIYIWTVDDNYPDGSSGAALTAFRNAKNAQSPNFEGDLAMLIARDPGGRGGVAYRGGLCRNVPYAYGDVNGSYSTVPTYSWDVQMVTHELGHNIASPHTHWCGWNTGSLGNCGAIDNCTTLESGSGCNTCPVTYSNSAPANSWRGTVMSYCHLRSRGISLANGFGPLPGDMMRDAVTSLTCLKSIISVTLNPTDICKDLGKVDVSFDNAIIGNNNFGASNYKYQWNAGNVTTKDINVVTQGTYSVTITDSNNCTETFSTYVPQSIDPNCLSTSVQDIERQYVSMYPNPAHNSVSLKFFSNKQELTSIRITDITGKIVKTETVSTSAGENNIVLNLNGVTSGMYYVSFVANGTDYMNLKLVVQ